MNITVLGGSGFIGQNLCSFLESNHNVQQISLRQNGWKKELADSDIIINLVGKAHDHKGNATEQDFYYANEKLVIEIFESFIKSQSQLLIHISSIASLEEGGSEKQLLETDEVNPQSYYGKSKRAGEIYLLNQIVPEGKKIIILRPPMVHGPGDKGTLTMLFKVVKFRIPWPLSSYNNKRSFLSIDNFNFIISEIIKQSKRMESTIYHISDDTSLSTNEIIKLMRKVAKRRSLNINLPKKFIIGIAKLGDILGLPLNTIRLNKMTSNLEVSNQKIKKALNIDKLPVSADEGITKTIQSFIK